MENGAQLAKRFSEVLLDGKWIAFTNIKEQLSDLSWQEATSKVGSLNTLAALTFHLDYYIGGILNVFEGGKLEIRDKFSFDLPPVKGEEDWQKLFGRLIGNSEKFAKYVEKMSEAQLESGFVDPKYGTYRRNIEAMIEHAYYHMGQVVLIKKMLREHE